MKQTCIVFLCTALAAPLFGRLTEEFNPPRAGCCL